MALLERHRAGAVSLPPGLSTIILSISVSALFLSSSCLCPLTLVSHVFSSVSVTTSFHLSFFVTCRHVWHKETATRQDVACQLAHQSIMCNFIRLTFECVCVCGLCVCVCASVRTCINKSNLSSLVLEIVINPLTLFLLSLPLLISYVHIVLWMCVAALHFNRLPIYLSFKKAVLDLSPFQVVISSVI